MCEERESRYAPGPDGREWPVIDITQPSFAVHPTDGEVAELTRSFVENAERRDRQPRWVQRLFLKIFFRKSVLIRSLRGNGCEYLDAMSTYRMKLGPEMLARTGVAQVDLKLAATLPFLAVRMRLQDTAEFLADGIREALASNPAHTLRLVNIAGGPAMDSLNALILLAKDPAEPLRGITVYINVFDLEPGGPAFGAGALRSLQAAGGPLEKVRVSFSHVAYNWRDPVVLGENLQRDQTARAVTVASSEGGLLDYGTDNEIIANLSVLRGIAGLECFVGSVTRADNPVAHLKQDSRFAVRPRLLPDFSELAARAGWSVKRTLTRSFGHIVSLVPDER